MIIKVRPGSEKTLGQILIAKGVISQEKLDLALKIKDVQPEKYLGEILFQLGVPQDKINWILRGGLGCLDRKQGFISGILL